MLIDVSSLRCVYQSAQNPELDLRFILLIITDCNRSLPIFTEIKN